MLVPIYLRDALYRKDLLPAWIQGVVSLCAVQSITIHEHEKGPRVCVGGWVVGWDGIQRLGIHAHIMPKVASIIVHINEKKLLYMHED